jgi:hypothetical protein
MTPSKRLIDGVTYNTETATLLAHCTYEGDWNNFAWKLYQTRGGVACMAVSRMGDRNLTLPERRSLSTSPWDLERGSAARGAHSGRGSRHALDIDQ